MASPVARVIAAASVTRAARTRSLTSQRTTRAMLLRSASRRVRAAAAESFPRGSARAAAQRAGICAQAPIRCASNSGRFPSRSGSLGNPRGYSAAEPAAVALARRPGSPSVPPARSRLTIARLGRVADARMHARTRSTQWRSEANGRPMTCVSHCRSTGGPAVAIQVVADRVPPQPRRSAGSPHRARPA